MYKYLLIFTIILLVIPKALADDFSSENFGFSPAKKVTLADKKLEEIVHNQLHLIQELEASPERFSDNERNRRFGEIFKRYDDFITENPENIYAYILYGKLLRQVSLCEEALKVFIVANKKDPNIAVIHQQIGNCLAEKGDYGMAMGYFLKAIELNPKIALYHYQLGELLCSFKNSFISSKILTIEEFDQQVLKTFDKARQIEPNTWIYQARYAESFFDIFNPNWADALNCWYTLEKVVPSIKEKELVMLNQARVLIKLERFQEAKQCLGGVFCMEFEKSRRELLELIPKLDN